MSAQFFDNFCPKAELVFWNMWSLQKRREVEREDREAGKVWFWLVESQYFC
jgi:hypothetical protein